MLLRSILLHILFLEVTILRPFKNDNKLSNINPFQVVNQIRSANIYVRKSLRTPAWDKGKIKHTRKGFSRHVYMLHASVGMAHAPSGVAGNFWWIQYWNNVSPIVQTYLIPQPTEIWSTSTIYIKDKRDRIKIYNTLRLIFLNTINLLICHHFGFSSIITIL